MARIMNHFISKIRMWHTKGYMALSLGMQVLFYLLFTTHASRLNAQSDLSLTWTPAQALPMPKDHGCLVFNNKMWIIGGYWRRNEVWWSADGINWRLATPSPAFCGRQLHACTVHNGKMWVIGGQVSSGANDMGLNDVWWSSDGVNWNLATNQAPFSPRDSHSCLSFGGKLWVIGGIGYTNGSRWATNDVWWSTDGTHWTQATGSAAFSKRGRQSAMVYNGRMWISGGFEYHSTYNWECKNDVWSSDDGVTWTQATANADFGPRENHISLVRNGQMWIIGGDSMSDWNYYDHMYKDAWTSKNGVTWTKVTDTAAFPVHFGRSAGLDFDNHIWFIGGDATESKSSVWWSDDGDRWAPVDRPNAFPERSKYGLVAYHNRLWVIGGLSQRMCSTNDVWYSDNGTSWSLATPHAVFSPRSGHTCLIYNDKLWIIGGSGKADVWSSTDGTSWTQATAAAAFGVRSGHTSVVFDDKMWVIGGNNSKEVWWSTNGTTWTQATDKAAFAGRSNHSSVVYDGKLWVLGGRSSNDQYGDVWCSTDGVQWVQTDNYYGSLPDMSNHASVVYDGKIWVLGGRNDVNNWEMNASWSTTDGKYWHAPSTTSAAGFPARYDHQAVVFNGAMWVGGGCGWEGDCYNRDDLWRSVDGEVWTRVSGSTKLPLGFLSTVVPHNNKLYAIGFSGQDPAMYVWSSADGQNWDMVNGTAPFSRRWGHSSVSYGGRIWVIGGYGTYSNLNDVWSSADGGITWQQSTDHAAFTPRSDHSSSVFNGKMWVIGGGGKTDAWWSDNGTTWTLATNATPFPALDEDISLVFNNRMWVVKRSGQTSGGVWSSADGVTWGKAIASPPLTSTYSIAGATFGNRLWLINYQDLWSKSISSIWCSDDGSQWRQIIPQVSLPIGSGKVAVVFQNRLLAVGGGPAQNDVWFATIRGLSGVKDWKLYDK